MTSKNTRKRLTNSVKYVSLLAFNKIVTSHPHLVSEYQDVILACIDDPDISIRLQALYLSVGMVNSDNLNMLVEALLQQLRTAPIPDGIAEYDRISSESVRKSTELNKEHVLSPAQERKGRTSHLPPEHKTTVIRSIMDMCNKDTYSNIQDFEWYINILVQLVDLVPTTPHITSMTSGATSSSGFSSSQTTADGTLCRIGEELRNVAVRMDFVRHNVVHASASLLHKSCKDHLVLARGEGVLSYVAWIVGEYANDLREVEETLSSLLLTKIQILAPTTLCAYLQAVPKLFVSSILRLSHSWDAECQTRVSLLLARMVHFFESLAAHPSLEVQERSVGFLELTRVAAQAVAGHDNSNMECPLFLNDAFAQLFISSKFKPMAPSAQRRVPVPDKLNLDSLFNPNLLNLLQMNEYTSTQNSNMIEFQSFYCNRTSTAEVDYTTANNEMMADTKPSGSYQDAHDFPTNVEVSSQKRQASRAREEDDPFYIASNNQPSKSSTSLFPDASSQTKGDDTDIESIPIMDLDLGDSASDLNISKPHVFRKKKRPSWQRYITPDETLDGGELPNPSHLDLRLERSRKPLLQVDSSGLDIYASKGARGESDPAYPGDYDAEDVEMQQALREVERLRLEMQRASERVQVSEGISQDGTMVKKKKKKKKASAPIDYEGGSSAPVSDSKVVKGEIKRKKKSKPVADHSEDG